MSVVEATVPESDYTLSFVRSAGPGGQNVNKVATAAQLRFDLRGTRVLNEAAKERLRVLAGRRLTDE
ncbi:MAG: peptide chain release factor-like protein, partial [Steroidobacteraceae bacterium]